MSDNNNLLFDPPRLLRGQKPKDLLQILARQDLAGEIYALYPGSGEELSSVSLQRASDSSFFICSALAEEQGSDREVYLKNIDTFLLLELGQSPALNSQGLLYFDGEDVCLIDGLFHKGYLPRYPFREKGDILGLHASQGEIYLLWQKHSGRVILSSFRRDAAMKVLDGKNALPDDLSFVDLENRGEKSVVLATADKNHVAGEVDFLLTLGPEGLGHPHYLREDVSLALRTLDSSGERFLSPGERDGSYFFLDGREERLSFLNEDGSVIPLGERLGSERPLALRSEGDRCLLLRERSLILFDREEELFRLDLRNELGYQDLSFSGRRATLWKRGRSQYLQVLLP